jgi:hypothetical protein
MTSKFVETEALRGLGDNLAYVDQLDVLNLTDKRIV